MILPKKPNEKIKTTQRKQTSKQKKYTRHTPQEKTTEKTEKIQQQPRTISQKTNGQKQEIRINYNGAGNQISRGNITEMQERMEKIQTLINTTGATPQRNTMQIIIKRARESLLKNEPRPSRKSRKRKTKTKKNEPTQ